jgi:beta-phosphoglucomutase
MNLKAVIFDFDGVILETSKRLFQGYKKVFDRFGVEYTEKHFNDVYGLKTKEHFRKILLDNSINLSNEELDRLVQDRDVYYRKICEADLEALPGVKDLLIELKDNHLKIGLASSTSRGNLEFFLPRLGLDTYFDVVFAGTDVAHGKPDPEIYLKTCDELEIRPNNCVGIEDTEIGVNALLNAGMKAVAVTITNRKQYDFSKADIVVNTLNELNVNLLQKLYS